MPACSISLICSLLNPEEAAKHGDAAYKYLYKAAVLLLERGAWQQLAGVCAALLAAAGGDAAAQQRAVQAVCKLSGHMPEEQAAAALAAVTARASSADLGSSAALDLLSLLCSATQRATVATTSQHLQQAALSCAASSQPVLQTTALLLPALALRLPASADWIAPVTAAVASLTCSIQQLEQQLAASARPLPLADLHRQLAVLEAAFQPANTLRRQLAARLASPDKAAGGGGDPSQVLGGAAAAGLAASVLELLAGMVGVGSRHSSGSTLTGQGHAAAVGLVTAARLRAAASDAHQLCSSQAVGWLLGWDFQRCCTDRLADIVVAAALITAAAAAAAAAAASAWYAAQLGVTLHRLLMPPCLARACAARSCHPPVAPSSLRSSPGLPLPCTTLGWTFTAASNTRRRCQRCRPRLRWRRWACGRLLRPTAQPRCGDGCFFPLCPLCASHSSWCEFFY